MSQKLFLSKLGLKQILFFCIATIICLATLGLGLGLGFGTGNKDNSPVEALQNENRMLPRGVTQVSAGGDYTMVIDSQGNLWAFGSGNLGKLGNMSTADNLTPMNITAQSGNPLNGKQIVQVSAGGNHTMAIDSQGNLWAFGYNYSGQLGNMTTTTTGVSNSTPINITAQSGNPLYGKQIVQVSTGSQHTIAIDSQGNLWAFGNNNNGKLGNMSTTATGTPINITAQSGNTLNGKQIVQVSAGDFHTMAIDSTGNLWAFGDGSYGQLGNMTTVITNSTPINITAQSGNPLNGKQIVQVSAGYEHTIAIDSQGSLWAFGYNNYGQIGNMSSTTVKTPINITAQSDNPLYGKQIVQVSAGNFHTMAIDSQGNLWTFGNNGNGQLGDMSATYSSTPIKITAQSGNPLNGKQIVQVSAGNYFTMAIDSSGNLWAYGQNNYGQLGNMSASGSNPNSTPINITAQSGNPLNSSQFGRMQVSAGCGYAMAIDANGNLWAFGGNSYGCLGNMSAGGGANSTPINITAQSGNPIYGKQIVLVSAGYLHTMVIDSQGNLWAFGNNTYGQLGNMSTSEYDDNNTPINITAQSGNPLNGKQIIQVSAGTYYTMVIDSQGNLWAYGIGSKGQLGNMATNQKNSIPINITAQSGNPLYGKQIVQVSAGSDHTIAIDSQGNLWAFGSGSNGELGNRSTILNNSTPINITAQSGNPLYGKQILQVSAGSSHTMAMDCQGNLWAFGRNTYGYLGNMTTSGQNPNSTPINITAQSGNPLNGKQITQVSAGYNHTMAIDSTGNLWAFGYNHRGQLGNMSTTESSTPINITAQSGNSLNGKQIVQVSASSSISDTHTMVIDSQGEFWAFGGGNAGQIGNMTNDQTNSTPINIKVPPQYASALATISGSTAARISVRTGFSTGWGEMTASGGTYKGWTANTLATPDVKRNDDTRLGRIRYEFDAAGVNTVASLSINGINITLNAYSALTQWIGLLYLRILTNGSVLIVEIDRINTGEQVILAVTTTRNVQHNFNFSNNSHLSSRMKMNSGAEAKSLSNTFTPSWNGNTGTVADTTFTFTSQAAFSKIIISRPSFADFTITTFIGSLSTLAPGSGLAGNISSSTGTTNTIIILLTGMQEYEYTWAIETYQIIQVQQILNPPAGATAIANPALLTLNSSAGAGWANVALAAPVNQFGKTFAGWYTHPDYTKGTLITTIEQLQQQINSTGGAVVFLYAHWA